MLRECIYHTKLAAYNSILPMNTRTFKTKHISKRNRCPLRMFHTTITAFIIARNSFYNLEIIRIHLRHDTRLLSRENKTKLGKEKSIL
jgi:hypothetical protein